MNKQKWVSVILAVVVVGGAALLVATTPVKKSSTGNQAPAGQNNQAGATSVKPTAALSQYTLVQVATHADGTSCWTVVNGGVYDLTAWIAQHPGGEEAIRSICGKDGSAAFNGQHGGQDKQEKILESFKIGTLK